MTIFGNVEMRAQLAFKRLCRQFGCEPAILAELRASDCQAAVERELSFYAKRHFFSRLYKLDLSFSLMLGDVPEGRADWVGGRQWQSAEADLGRWLEQRPELARQLRQLDTERVSLESSNGQVKLLVRPIPGCFIWTLLPPMHYFVRLKDAEVALISGLPGLLLAAPFAQAA